MAGGTGFGFGQQFGPREREEGGGEAEPGCLDMG